MQRFLRAIASEPWAIHPPKAQEILGYLEARMSGEFSEEARMDPNKRRRTQQKSGAISVINVHGAIANRAGLMDGESLGTGTSAERLENDIRAAVNDESVKAIVLDVNSPGGSAAGTPELASAIREMRGSKPIVAQVNALAASAAYWIASSADEIVATESSQVGSIGVISVHESIAKMLEDEGVEETIISAGKYKAEGNPFEPLDSEAQEHMQSMVNKYYTMFLDAIAAGRGVDKETIESEFGQGRVKLAAEAKKAGMIDRIGTMRETLERLGAEDQPRAAARSTSLQKQRLELERQEAQT